jgi:hypothetical protein
MFEEEQMYYGLSHCTLGDMCLVISNVVEDDFNRNKGQQRTRRQEITNDLKDNGFLCPEPISKRLRSN